MVCARGADKKVGLSSASHRSKLVAAEVLVVLACHDRVDPFQHVCILEELWEVNGLHFALEGVENDRLDLGALLDKLNL